jgi:hypothetical protein
MKLQHYSTIYIVCEGEKTEKKYFDKIKKLININLKYHYVIGSGKSVKKLENAAKEVQRANRGAVIYLCYDIDDKKGEELDKAMENANQADSKHLVSSRQFEVWLNWHFSEDTFYKPTEPQKDELYKKIDLLTKQHIQDAINRAKYNNNIECGQPFSTVFKLLEGLANYS